MLSGRGTGTRKWIKVRKPSKSVVAAHSLPWGRLVSGSDRGGASPSHRNAHHTNNTASR